METMKERKKKGVKDAVSSMSRIRDEFLEFYNYICKLELQEEGNYWVVETEHETTRKYRCRKYSGAKETRAHERWNERRKKRRI